MEPLSVNRTHYCSLNNVGIPAGLASIGISLAIISSIGTLHHWGIPCIATTGAGSVLTIVFAAILFAKHHREYCNFQVINVTNTSTKIPQTLKEISLHLHRMIFDDNLHAFEVCLSSYKPEQVRELIDKHGSCINENDYNNILQTYGTIIDGSILPHRFNLIEIALSRKGQEKAYFEALVDALPYLRAVEFSIEKLLKIQNRDLRQKVLEKVLKSFFVIILDEAIRTINHSWIEACEPFISKKLDGSCIFSLIINYPSFLLNEETKMDLCKAIFLRKKMNMEDYRTPCIDCGNLEEIYRATDLTLLHLAVQEIVYP
jgi:hypothetical protein